MDFITTNYILIILIFISFISFFISFKIGKSLKKNEKKQPLKQKEKKQDAKVEKKPEVKVVSKPKVEKKPEVKVVSKPKVEKKLETIEKDYGLFDTTRAKEEFEMDDEEIEEFVLELTEQIQDELLSIEKYIEEWDLPKLKDSIHKIKGSAVNLGTGGIAEVLYQFNDYLSKKGEDPDKMINFYLLIEKYMKEMKK